MKRQLLLLSGALLAASLSMAATPDLRPLKGQKAGMRNFEPTSIKAAPALTADTPEGYVFFESFEGWDGTDPEWTPEGWTVDMRGEVERSESWTPAAKNPYYPAPSHGESFYAINYGSAKQDEWLISPEVSVGENMEVSFYLWLTPLYLYSMDNVNWDTMEYEGGKQVAATLQVWAQPEGGEWAMLHDFADDYMDMDYMELSSLYYASLVKKSFSLGEYAGKKVKIGFRYVGTDGNTMFIDAVGVGFPSLDGVTYIDPTNILYWGFARGWEMNGLMAAIAQFPVNSPIGWLINSDYNDVDYTWTYADPATGEMTTSNDPSELEVTYTPRYIDGDTVPFTFFAPPTLTVEAPNAIPGTYTAPYSLFQAGGKAERKLNDGTMFEGSLFPFSYVNDGTEAITVDDASIGDPAIPVFGHNANTDKYWLNYSLKGDEEIPGDYVRLEGIANIFFPSDAPLVVNGANIYGRGKMADDAQLTFTVYGLNEELSRDFTTFTVIASDTITGKDILAEYNDDNGYICLPFDFDTPAVVKATEKHPAYAFMLQGFNSDKVEYFVPLQSAKPDPYKFGFGYILTHINLGNHVEGLEPYYSFKPMVYKENGDYVDPYAAFAIGINAEYPWLTTEATDIKVSAEAPVEVALDSYYAADKLTVEAPTGTFATIKGRYNKSVLTVTRDMTDVIVEGEVVVKGPGVELRLPVSELSGIETIDPADDATITGIYDLSGRRVENAATGVYIVKYSDGTVRKSLLK